MKILFIQTGGTIDKDYPQTENSHGYNFEIGNPAFDRILERVCPDLSFFKLKLLRKDSLEINSDDRRLICERINEYITNQIVITHGTDTIKTTAEAMSESTLTKDRTIVLTGALLPEKFKDSDADFNLGMAIAAVQILRPGIYIGLNGKVVPWYEFGG